MTAFDTYVRLIDLSRYQEGPNDFEALKRGGYVAAVTRWGVGTYRDPTRLDNLRAIIAAGLVPGTYFVPAANVDGGNQAAQFIREVRDVFGDRPMLYVGDVEHSNSFGDPSAALAADFFATGHQLTGRSMGGYIPKWYMDGHSWTSAQVAAIAPHAWWWQSRYQVSPALNSPPDAAGYKGWPLRAWQWTSTGPAPGIPGDCDKNVYYGTLADLRAAAGYTGGFLMTLSDAEQDELLAGVRTLVKDRGVEPVRLVKEGFVTGDPVYLTDYRSYIYEVGQNGPLDDLVQDLKALTGHSRSAQRMPQTLIDDMLRRLPHIPNPPTVEQIATAVNAPTADEIAEAVVAKLPTSAGGEAPTLTEIKTAVHEVLGEVQGVLTYTSTVE